MISVRIAGCLSIVLLHPAGIQKLHLRVVKNLAISADHIEITTAPRRDAAKELFQARIADIDQKDALRGRGSVCQFDRPR